MGRMYRRLVHQVVEAEHLKGTLVP
jgi:hypothetical protein